MIRGAKHSSLALGETLRLALDALRGHKLRSFLTLLGIILAVTTLVSVMSVVNGLNLYVAERIANLGADTFVIDRFGIITNEEEFFRAQKRPLLTVEDFQALQSGLRLSKHIVATENSTMDVVGGDQMFEDARLIGVSPDYAVVRNISVANGRFFTETDEVHRQPVCILGADLANKFFPNVDPIGKSVRAGSESYQVVGVAAPLGNVFGQSQDIFLLIPFATYEKTWHAQTGSITLFVEAQSTDLVDAAEDEARAMLRARRHTPFNAPDPFGILGSASIMNLWQQITGNIFAMAVWLTSVFMVVGGIVVMNIMLASVTERTREIGIRKALGARRANIIMQFLVESAMLTAFGGAIGLVLAAGIAALVRSTIGMPMAIPASAIVTSLLVSTSVGLFFGIYPAVRASRLDPIEALRAET